MLHSVIYLYIYYILSNKYPVFRLVKLFIMQLYVTLSLLADIRSRVHLSVKNNTYRYFLKYISYSHYYVLLMYTSRKYIMLIPSNYAVSLSLVIFLIFEYITFGIINNFSKFHNIRYLIHKINQ